MIWLGFFAEPRRPAPYMEPNLPSLAWEEVDEGAALVVDSTGTLVWGHPGQYPERIDTLDTFIRNAYFIAIAQDGDSSWVMVEAWPTSQTTILDTLGHGWTEDNHMFPKVRALQEDPNGCWSKEFTGLLVGEGLDTSYTTETTWAYYVTPRFTKEENEALTKRLNDWLEIRPHGQ